MRTHVASARVPVPACPGWTVHDVIGHLVGIIEDAVAGRLSGVPDEALTDQQVGRHRDDDLVALLDQWDVMGPFFEPVLTQRQIVAAVMDVWTHEQDVRSALGQPGARQDPFVSFASDRLLASLQEGGAVPVCFASNAPDNEPEDQPVDGCVLRVSRFEFIRARLGRRTGAQVAALEWSLDADALSPVLDRFFVFGPAVAPIVE